MSSQRSASAWQADDRGLQLVRTGALLLGGADHQPGSRGDRRVVPQGPVLVRQQHEADLAVEAGRGARPVQPDQREQARDLRLASACSRCSRPASHSASSTRSRECGRARGRQVALVEQQVDARRARPPAGRRARRRRGLGRGCRASVIFRLARVIRCAIVVSWQERPGDLGRGQAAHDPQGQRDLGRSRAAPGGSR